MNLRRWRLFAAGFHVQRGSTDLTRRTAPTVQPQRRGSAEPREPRDDRIPRERIVPTGREPAMPMATDQSRASFSAAWPDLRTP
jgi:hypothetical protein